MIKWFLGNRPIVLLLLPLIVGFFVLTEYFVNGGAGLPKEVGLFGNIESVNVILVLIFSIVVVSFIGIRAARLFNTNGFSDKNTYITALLYVCTFAMFTTFFGISSATISTVFLLLMLIQLFRLQQNMEGKKQVFNAGIFYGLAICFTPKLLFLVPIIYALAITIRPFKLRELILTLTGIAVPLLYVVLAYSFLDLEVFFNFDAPDQTRDVFPLEKLTTVFLLVVIVLAAFASVFSSRFTTSIRTKKIARILVVFTIGLFLLGLYEFLFFGELGLMSLVSLPLSLLFSITFMNSRAQLFGKILLYLILALVTVKFFI